MRHHQIPDNIPSDMHNTFRNLIDDAEAADIPLIHDRETLHSIPERKRVWMLENGELCMYVRVAGRLYCNKWEQA